MVSFWCHPQQLGPKEPRGQALSTFSSTGRREAWDLTLFPHPTETRSSAWKQTSLKSKNYRGTKWKWTGPDQSNACLKHYCAVLVSWGSTWTLTIDWNPLGNENKNTAFEKTRCSYMEFTGSIKNNLLMWVTAVQSAYINFPFCITPVCPSSK